MIVRIARSAIRPLLAIVFCCSGLPAANLLTATPATLSLTCNTVAGPGPAVSILIKPVAALTTNTIAVTTGSAPAGVVLIPPTPASLNSANQSQGLTYTVSAAAGCAGASSGSSTIRFIAGGAADVSVPLTMTVLATASPLAATPVTLTCIRNAGSAVTYTPGPTQSVTVVSAAAGGTPFTVDTGTSSPWLSVTPSTGGIAGTSGIPLSVRAVAPCGNYAAGSSNSGSIRLQNPPAPEAIIPVNLQILGPAPVTATPAAPSLSYTKGSGSPGTQTVVLSANGSAAAPFAVDPTSLPVWLSADLLSGTTPASLHFTTTAVADTIAPGTYTATVQVQTQGYANLAVPFRLTVSDPPPTLTIAEGTTRNLAWTIGQPLPIPFITLASSGAAIPYSITTGGPLGAIIGSSFLKGFAYNYDTPIPVTFNPIVFGATPAGTSISGTVSITWGSPAVTTVVTINVSVQAAPALLSSVTPLVLPPAAPGKSFTVALGGTGFVASSDATQRTIVGIVSGGGTLVADPNLAAAVLNSSNIILTITVPDASDRALPFAPGSAGGTVTLGVCNPAGAACTTPTGTATLTIGANPLIEAVTSASAFLQVTPPSTPVVAPYDMISLFGINFCSAGGTGCGDSVLYGMPDPSSLRFPTFLSPDSSGGPQRQLTVTFQTHSISPVAIGSAPLFFATDGQINLLVPSAVSAFIGKTVDIVVSFGSSTSAPFSVNVAAADPGVFTIGTNGQGDGAILGSDLSLVTQDDAASVRKSATDSDIVQIYATGLGAPDSTADNGSAGNGTWPSDCVGVASFLSSLNSLTSSSFTTLDGAPIASAALKTGRFAPCFRSAVPKVTIGGQPGLVTYAGWVSDAVAGQYQVNVRLPGSGGPFTTATGAVIAGPLTVPVELPVVITSNGRASQPGVTVWVAPQLKVTAPSSTALRGAEKVAWAATGNAATASDGTPPYHYAMAAGALPAGLAFNTVTGAITGTPIISSAGSYTLTISATDSAAIPLTGSVTFVLTVAAAH